MSGHNVLQSEVYVAALAEEGSFSKAAQRLHTEQAFITKQIAKIEKWLRLQLFARSTRRVELTQVGHIIVPQFQRAVRQSERAWDLAQHYSQLMNGPIRIGHSPYAHDTIVRTLFQLDIAEFEARKIRPKDSPVSGLEFDNSSTPELIERVLRGKLHAALGVHPIHNHDLWIEPIAKESFCLCLPRGHALNKRPTIAARELNGLPVIWLPQDMHPGLYKSTTEYIRSTGAHPIYKEFREIARSIDMVAHGFGVALLPQSASHFPRSGVVFKPMADRYLQIETVLFARRNLAHDILKEFTEFLAPRLRPPQPQRE